MVPAAKISPHVNLIKLLSEGDKLRANMKLHAAVSHKSHLLKVKSKLTLHIKLDVPNINKVKSDILM